MAALGINLGFLLVQIFNFAIVADRGIIEA